MENKILVFLSVHKFYKYQKKIIFSIKLMGNNNQEEEKNNVHLMTNQQQNEIQFESVINIA